MQLYSIINFAVYSLPVLLLVAVIVTVVLDFALICILFVPPPIIWTALGLLILNEQLFALTRVKVITSLILQYFSAGVMYTLSWVSLSLTTTVQVAEWLPAVAVI